MKINMKPRVVLFFSVDLIGSTPFKQSCIRNGKRWMTAFIKFIKGFPEDLRDNTVQEIYNLQRVNRRSGLSICTLNIPEVWKLIGDEILFKTELETLEQVPFIMNAFVRTLADWDDRLTANEGGIYGDLSCFPKETLPNLGVKGAAWLAGFPVGNASIEIGSGHEDFLGPSIDLAGRLPAIASRQRMPLSVELAYVLVKGVNHSSLPMTIHNGGSEPFKGMYDGAEYPRFYLCLEGVEGNCDVTPCPPESVETLCEQFMREHDIGNLNIWHMDGQIQQSDIDDYIRQYNTVLERHINDVHVTVKNDNLRRYLSHIFCTIK
ncbi:MAG: hypothetical protein HQL50_06640 [Magnetococcales bacterium]|nr:hypothetical protein [Magnetococcales bacterium]